jgi:hypothetical protein
MSRKKISTTIYVTPEQSDRLRVLHERTKVPVAVYIREGIDLVLRQYAHLLPGQLALDGGGAPARQGPSDGASSTAAPSTPIVGADPGDKPERAVSGGK